MVDGLVDVPEVVEVAPADRDPDRGHQRANTILPNTSPLGQRRERLARLRQRHRRLHHRPHVALDAQPHEPLELVAGAHRRADDAQLQEEHARQTGRRVGAARRARDHERPARLQRLQGVLPGRRADGLHDGVDPLRQPRARLERLVGAQFDRPRALGLGPARRPHAQARGAAEHDQRRGDAAARALDQDRRARRHARAREQHPVGGQPRRRQARRLRERELRRLGHEVAPRHRDPLGERPGVALRQDRAPRVQRLVAAPSRVRDHRVDDDLVAVLVEPGGVAAEDHRQRILAKPDAPQRPQVVVIQRRGADLDRRPALGDRRLRPLAHLQPGQADPRRRSRRRRRRTRLSKP